MSLVLCDCLGSQKLDRKALARATGLDCPPVCSQLCTSEQDRAAKAIEGGEVLIACQQQARVFEDLAHDLGQDAPAFVDLRDRAGWTADEAPTLPKMAALIAEAQLPASPIRMMDVESQGICLIVGADDTALTAAETLKSYLPVTVLIPNDHPAPDLAGTPDGYDVVRGVLRRASGALGQFSVTIDQLQTRHPGGRGAQGWSTPRDGGKSECDILLDLRGGDPLFPAPEKREGYLRADPRHPNSVAQAILDASHLTGTFEKPLYLDINSLLCAHSRAKQSGCSRCLDLCPTGAITPDGDHVAIDPMICAGCGACSSACPSGAVSFDAPSVAHTIRRVQVLAKAYLDAGGTAPRLLVHDDHGAEMIRLAARYGRGLPADVIPLGLPGIGPFGHAEMLAALAAGFASVTLLPGPGTDNAALETQRALASALSQPGAIECADVTDPDALCDLLYAQSVPAAVKSPVRPIGSRRQITRQAARALHPDGAIIALPEGAPYGQVVVNTDACTLCLSCASLCPSAALSDNPDAPQLRFQEDACLQCGLCETICPENAISCEPRLNLGNDALSQKVLHEEEPFACVECGALFGVRSTIERISERLSGHSMFDGAGRLRMIQMCDRCRVTAQYHDDTAPFAGPQRPKPRTTDDYLSKRRDH